MQPQGPWPQQAPPFQPPPVVKWYHQKWFVVLMLIVFFPIGLALLWTSPVTKMSGRFVWTLLVALSFVIYISGGGSDTPSSNSTASNSTTSNSTKPTTPAAPPKDEYPFKLTDKASGKVFQGKIVSNVGVAVLDVTKAKTVGTNQFLTKQASSGAVFVEVKVGVSNDQKDAITMDGNLFNLLADGREYSYSTEAMTALMASDTESFFLKKINPGLTAVGTIVFEVPENLNVDAAQLQFRGGMTGKSDTLPLKPITQ